MIIVDKVGKYGRVYINGKLRKMDCLDNTFDDETFVKLDPRGVMMFDECYPEMFQELMKAHNEKEKKLRRFYEEYGRLVFMKNNCH